MRRILAVLTILLAVTAVARAVTPDEILDDPALEARARAISAKLRCLVCQNQSIDDSDAQLAHDLRVIVRERLEAGDTDEQVMDYVVARYGEFVLLQPRLSARNLLLWGTPVLGLLAGGFAILVLYRRRQGPATAGATLSAEEEERIAKMLADSDEGSR